MDFILSFVDSSCKVPAFIAEKNLDAVTVRALCCQVEGGLPLTVRQVHCTPRVPHQSCLVYVCQLMEIMLMSIHSMHMLALHRIILSCMQMPVLRMQVQVNPCYYTCQLPHNSQPMSRTCQPSAW